MGRWRLDVDLSASPSFTAEPVLTPILDTADITVVNGRTSRGGTDPLVAPKPSVLELVLYDPQRRLDPTNTSSPWYGITDARRMVRFWARNNELTPTDSDFEDGIGGWLSGNATLTQSAAVPAGLGLRVLRIQAAAATDVEAASGRVPVQPGVTYFPSMAIQPATVARSSVAEIHWYTQADVFIGTAVGSPSTSILGAWWPLTIPSGAVAPANAAWMRVGPKIIGAASGEVHYLDLVGVAKGVTPWQEPQFTGFAEHWDYDLRTHTATLTATDALSLMGQSANVVSRFDYEAAASNPSDWWRMGEPSSPNETWAWSPAENRGSRRSPGGYLYKPDRGQDSLVSYDPTSSVRFPLLRNSAVGPQLLAYLGWRYSSDWTFAFWFRYGPIGASDVELGRVLYAGTANRWFMWKIQNEADVAAGELVLYAPGSLTTRIARSTLRVDDDRPHFIVFVVGVSAAPIIYVDGINATTSATLVGGWNVLAEKQLSVGNPENVDAAPLLQDMMVWDRVLGPTEVSALYEAGSSAGRGEGSMSRALWALDRFGFPAWLRSSLVGGYNGNGREEMGPTEIGGTNGLDYVWRTILTERGRMYVDRSQGHVRMIPRPAVEPALAHTFANDGSVAGALRYVEGVPTASLNDVVNVVEVGRQGGGSPVVVRDEGSIASHLELPFKTGELLHMSDELAEAFGRHVLARRATRSPHMRRIVVDTRAGNTERKGCAQSEIGDYVRVKCTPSGGGDPLDEHAWIEGITQEFDSGLRWTVAFDLSPYYAPPVAFTRAYRTTAQNIATGIWTAILMDAEAQDDDGMHSTSTNTSQFFPQVNDVYRMHGFVQFAANGTGRRGAAIVKNNATFLGEQLLSKPTDAVGVVVEVFAEMPLVVGDYVELQALQESGGGLNVDVASGISPELRIAR